MVGVQARVDDGHPHARAGITVLPGLVGAGHLPGDTHLGLIGPLVPIGGNGLGLVALLLHHALDAVHGGDLFDGAIGHVGGDHVGSQGQVPDDVQLLAVQSYPGDLAAQRFLLGLQALPVAHGPGAVGDLLGGVARFQGGLLFQDDGHTDHVAGRVGLLLCRVGLLLLLSGQLCGHKVVVDLLNCQLGQIVPAGRSRRDDQTCQQCHGQQKRKDPAASGLLFHCCSSF